MIISRYVYKSLQYALTLLLGLVSLATQAQFDTDYWMPPVWESRDGGSTNPTELLITTAYPTANYSVTLSNGLPISVGQVKRGTPVTVLLDTLSGMTFEANTVEDNKGLLIKADYPVQAVYRNTSGNNQCLVPLKGLSGLGKDFRAGSQTRVREGSYGANDLHFISVMATENDTRITIESPENTRFFGGESMVNITLDKHQTYLVRNTTAAGSEADNVTNNLVGSHITANKPIAVVSGGQHLRYINSGNADAGIDQLVPTSSDFYEVIGTQYIVVRGGTESQSGVSTDYALVVGTVDNTEVYINGISTPVATIGAGEVFEYVLPGGPEEIGTPYLIETSEKAFVYHVSGLRQHEVGMSAVPSIGCTGSNYLEFTRFGGNDNYIHIMAPDVAFSTPASLTINDNPYTDYDGTAQAVPGNIGWKTISFSYSTDEPAEVIVQSSEFFHLGVVVGGSQGGTYGYLSGFPRKIDVLDPLSQLPTTRYVVDTLEQGSTVTHCLDLQSCNDQYHITSISPSVNTGSVSRVGEPGQPMDTCLQYTARADYVGDDTLRVDVTNAMGVAGTVELIYHITQPVSKPIANDDGLIVNQDEPATGNVVENDESLQFGGGVELVTDVENGSLELNPDGSFTYLPNVNFTGVDTFVYQLCSKDNPAVCVLATVTLDVRLPDPIDTQLDSDNDGIIDEIEKGDDPQNPLDTDQDGIPDYQDTDSDNDGLPDQLEAGNPNQPVDTDLDGTPDYRDPDSDDDGIPDSYQDLLTIYEGFSPDGDGVNDTWVIEGIDNFPDNEVQVFNRWGNRVFQAESYNNQEVVWGSQSTLGLVVGQSQVPGGTYFYLIDLRNGKRPLSGYIIVNH